MNIPPLPVDSQAQVWQLTRHGLIRLPPRETLRVLNRWHCRIPGQLDRFLRACETGSLTGTWDGQARHIPARQAPDRDTWHPAWLKMLLGSALCARRIAGA